MASSSEHNAFSRIYETKKFFLIYNIRKIRRTKTLVGGNNLWRLKSGKLIVGFVFFFRALP